MIYHVYSEKNQTFWRELLADLQSTGQIPADELNLSKLKPPLIIMLL